MSRERELRHHPVRHLGTWERCARPPGAAVSRPCPGTVLLPRLRPHLRGQLLEEIDVAHPESEPAWIEYAYRDIPAITHVNAHGYSLAPPCLR
jgi:hypothetical protein